MTSGAGSPARRQVQLSQRLRRTGRIEPHHLGQHGAGDLVGALGQPQVAFRPAELHLREVDLHLGHGARLEALARHLGQGSRQLRVGLLDLDEFASPECLDESHRDPRGQQRSSRRKAGNGRLQFSGRLPCLAATLSTDLDDLGDAHLAIEVGVERGPLAGRPRRPAPDRGGRSSR